MPPPPTHPSPLSSHIACPPPPPAPPLTPESHLDADVQQSCCRRAAVHTVSDNSVISDVQHALANRAAERRAHLLQPYCESPSILFVVLSHSRSFGKSAKVAKDDPSMQVEPSPCWNRNTTTAFPTPTAIGPCIATRLLTSLTLFVTLEALFEALGLKSLISASSVRFAVARHESLPGCC